MPKKSKINTVVILAGGLGTRLSEETKKKPKPMVKIGNEPILWHIIMHYKHFGFRNIIICAGYKGFMIKNYFKKKKFNNLNIKVIPTGIKSLTATRLIKIKKLLPEQFCMTYGDAVSNLNLNSLIRYHIKKKSFFTVTGVIPVSKYGSLMFNKKNQIVKFMEKKDFENNFVSGGYFVINKKCFRYLQDKKNQMLEREPMSKIAKTGKMFIYKHRNFWQCMDTLRDKLYLEKLWKKNPKWKIWKK